MLCIFLPLCVLLLHGVSGADTDRESVTVNEGDSVTLNTDVKTNHRDRIKWYFNDTRIAQIIGNISICTDVQCNEGTERFRDRLKLDHQTGSLTITNIRNTDSGEYKLQITSSSIDSLKIFTVTVSGAVVVSVMEGDSVTLNTGVTKNQQDRIMWYFNHTRIAQINGDIGKLCTDVQCKERFRDRLKLDHQTGSLTITNTRNTDSGDYELEIISSKISIMKRFSVFVHGVSGVDKDEVSLMEGDSVTLHTGVETNQQKKILWYINDIRIAQITVDQTEICTDVQWKGGDERFRDRLKLDKRTGSLIIMNIRTSDAGLYKLQINSSRISIIKRFSVTVTSVSGVDKDKVSVMEGDSVTLNTGVRTDQQEKIKWYFKDTRIAQIGGDLSKVCTDVQCNEGTERFRDRLKLDHQTGSLTIMNISNTDSGDYELEIISSKISIMKRFSIFVHGVSAADRDKMKRKSVMEGESVTLDPGNIQKTYNSIMWYFNDTLMAEITGDESKICTDEQCSKRFRHRLEVNHTGSLTITNTRNTDSGEYKLKITNIRFSIMESFNVSVTAAVAGIYAAVVGVVVGVLLLVAAGLIYYCKPQARRNVCCLNRQQYRGQS